MNGQSLTKDEVKMRFHMSSLKQPAWWVFGCVLLVGLVTPGVSATMPQGLDCDCIPEDPWNCTAAWEGDDDCREKLNEGYRQGCNWGLPTPSWEWCDANEDGCLCIYSDVPN